MRQQQAEREQADYVSSVSSYPEPSEFQSPEEFERSARPSSYAPPEEQQQTKKRFSAGEPVYLYVKTSATSYDNVGEFGSRVEASHAAESEWRGYQYKTMTASEARAEQERLQARRERIQKTVKTVEKVATKAGSGLKRLATNIGRNAESEARYHGMIHDRPSPPSQSVNVNVNTGEKGESVDNLRRMDEHIRGRQPESAPSPRKEYMIQKPGSKFFFAPPESPIKPFKHAINPPASLIKPSRYTLDPPRPSQNRYVVGERHGGFVFSDSVRPYRIPIYSRFRQSEPVQVKSKHTVIRSNHKRTTKRVVKKRRK